MTVIARTFDEVSAYVLVSHDTIWRYEVGWV